MRHGWDNGRYGGGYVYQSGRRTWAQAGPQYNNRSNNNRSFGNRTFGNMQRGGVNDSPLRTGNRSFGSQPQSQARPRSFGMSTDTNRSFGIPHKPAVRHRVSEPGRTDQYPSLGGDYLHHRPAARPLHPPLCHRPHAVLKGREGAADGCRTAHPVDCTVGGIVVQPLPCTRLDTATGGRPL